MRAVILAAGRGTRLGSHTRQKPKALVAVGGRPLIIHSLDRLAEAGIEETIIVTGYQADRLRARLGECHRDMPLSYVHNADYRVGGSMVSLLKARPHCPGPSVLVLECDLLYDPGFIAAALETAWGDVLLAAACSGSGDEVYLCAGADGRLAFLGKDANPEQCASAVGEFAGITKLSAPLFDDYCTTVQAHLARDPGERHYEDILFDLAQRNAALYVLACPGLPWTEVDNEADLMRAEQTVFPALGKIIRPR